MLIFRSKRFLFLILIVILGILCFFYYQANIICVPNFKDIKNISVRKQAFIKFLLPYINVAELKVCEQRRIISDNQKRLNFGQILATNEINDITAIAKQYRYDLSANFNAEALIGLLNKVNIVPKSLVLAQAALESGWGTSRFSIEGYNFFGQHCFKQGCGIKPKYQSPGKVDEVRKFNSPEQSVSQYMLLLNSGAHFQKFREIREKQISNSKNINSIALLNGLGSYSELGLTAYKNRLLQTIQYNQLTKFDGMGCSL